MLTYAALLRKYIDQRTYEAYNAVINNNSIEQIELDYKKKINKLYNRLRREYNVDMNKFCLLKEQAMTL